MTSPRLHPDRNGSATAGAFSSSARTGEFDVGGAAVEGDVLGGRPTVPDRQPPAVGDPGVDNPASPAYEPARDDQATAGGRSLLATALSQTLRRWGARIGLTWVAVLVLLSVFAPFLANSRPVLARLKDGSLISPMWRGLTTVDVALPLLFFGTIIAFVIVRLTRPPRWVLPAVLAGVTLLSFGLGYLKADPPLLERFSTYRRAEAKGDYAWAVKAPIPFSPDDTLRDVGDPYAVQPWWAAPAKDALGSLAFFDGASDETRANLARVSTRHWLGTTINGEDMASRMIHASRIALAIGLLATGIAAFVGVIVGAAMGYFGGLIDLLGMRLIEIVQAIPVIIVLLIVMNSFDEKNIWLMMTAIGLLSWTTYARFLRAEFLRLRGQDFVQAARAAGLGTPSILFRHMLPNGVAPVLVNASFGVANAILLESVLSFLGLGLEAKDPSWGQLLNQARSGGTGFNWWIATFPGLAIFLTVFAYILIGEAMRDAIDPKLKKAGE